MDPQLELIKLARHIHSPISLVAFALLIVYMLASPAYRYSAKSRGKAIDGVITKVWILALVVTVLALVPQVVATVSANTEIHGVVLRRGTSLTLAGAMVSIDGITDVKAETGSDGNFRINVPSRERDTEYVVRVQYAGRYGASAKVADRDASQKPLTIKIDVPSTPTADSVTTRIGPNTTLRGAIWVLVSGDSSTPVFMPSCPATFLQSKLREGELRAADTVQLIEQLQYRFVSPQNDHKLRVTRHPDRGTYEIACTK